jgi:hypothetical protein
MIFGGEVDDRRARRVAVQTRLTQSHLLGIAPAPVVLEHGRPALLELQRHPFAHHPDAVDGIDEGLRLTREEVADECSKHSRSLILSAKEKN